MGNDKEQMMIKKTWKEFQESGMLWLVNRTLQIVGWSIVLEFSDNGVIVSVYPVRSKFRGFSEESEDRGFRRIAKYLRENIVEIEKDIG